MKNGPLPFNCPSCRNVRWNQTYTDEDMVLIKQLTDQHMIKENVEVVKDKDYDDIEYRYDHYDFIAYDFLYNISPRPDIFEVKQILKIPEAKIEERHELMLSIIRDRIVNEARYKKEHYSKYSSYSNKSKYPDLPIAELFARGIKVRRKMKGCKHEEDLEIVMALHKCRYWSNKGKFEISDSERIPGSETIYTEAEAKLEAAVKNRSSII